MPSRAEGRLRLERACRAAALVVLGLLAWRVGRPREIAPIAVPATHGLDDALTRATLTRVPRLSLGVDSLPDERQREWLAAIRGSGTVVQWRAVAPLPALAVATEPLVDPQGGVRIAVSAPAGTTLRVVDSVGTVDSVRVEGTGVRIVEAMGAGGVRALVARGAARAAAADSLELRAVLVIARAGWEGRFTAAALEEAGWRVEADFQVNDPAVPNAGPAVAVRTPAATQPIDTARYAAVVALDGSAASRGAAIARFVRSGGGLVLGPEAARGATLGELAPARSGASFDGALGGLAGSTPRRGLSGVALTSVRGDAVVLERRGAAVLVVARREALGRVLALGYVDTWRWRLEGGPGAPDEHRAWWSGLVGSVARPVLVTPRVSPVQDAAPYAGLVARLGAAGASTDRPPPLAVRWEPWLFAGCILLLMTEWASRRTRGAV